LTYHRPYLLIKIHNEEFFDWTGIFCIGYGFSTTSQTFEAEFDLSTAVAKKLRTIFLEKTF